MDEHGVSEARGSSPLLREPILRAAPDEGSSIPEPLRQFARRKRAAWQLLVLAVLVDASVICVSFLTTNFLRFGSPFFELGLNMVAIVVPIYLAVAANRRAYSMPAISIARAGAWRSVTAFFTTLSVVGLVVFFLKASTDLSRAVFAAGAALAFILLPLARLGVAKLTRRVFPRSALCEIIIEDGSSIADTSEAVVLNAADLGLSPRLDSPEMFDRLGRHVLNADRVIIVCPPERRSWWAFIMKGLDVNAEIVAPDLDELGALGIGEVSGSSTLLIASAPLGRVERTMKRTLDLVLTVLAMPIALPVMVLVAIAIRLDSPGPILFRQHRVGLGNRIFSMYKFRSMYTERTDASGAQSASRIDDRITRVGRFIRATSLDELPQLFNVLTGSMSIVGPRPHPLRCMAEDRLLWEIDLRYWHRHSVKPGLTGLAQVRGLRGATEKEHHFTDRLQADLEYLSGWTIWRDIKIIFATFRVLVHRNAF